MVQFNQFNWTDLRRDIILNCIIENQCCIHIHQIFREDKQKLRNGTREQRHFTLKFCNFLHQPPSSPNLIFSDNRSTRDYRGQFYKQDLAEFCCCFNYPKLYSCSPYSKQSAFLLCIFKQQQGNFSLQDQQKVSHLILTFRINQNVFVLVSFLLKNQT